MAEAFAGESDIDATAPVVSNRAPADLSIGNLLDDNVSFKVDDPGGAGVVQATIDVTVEGNNAIVNGVFQTGYDGVGSSISASGDGFDVVIDPTSNFPSHTPIIVTVYAEDADENVVNDSWTFEAGDIIAPTIQNQVPAVSSTGADLDADVIFDVIDDSADPNATGVDITTLNVFINGTPVVINNVAEPGYTVSSTPITDGYQVTVGHDDIFSPFSVIGLNVKIDDNDGNSANVSWSFTTTEGDIITPTLKAVGDNEKVTLTWSVPETVLKYEWRLRKGTSGFPTNPGEGFEVFSDPIAESFVDTDVENGKRYFYTIFLVRRLDDDNQPVYVPYDVAASDDAVPRLIVAPDPVETEYIPQRGELAPLVDPLPGASVRSDTGRELSYNVDIGSIIRSPVNGVLTRYDVAGGHRLDVQRGDLVFSFYPVRAVAPDGQVAQGGLIARAPSSGITVTISKLPGRYIKPTYALLSIEKRDGS